MHRPIRSMIECHWSVAWGMLMYWSVNACVSLYTWGPWCQLYIDYHNASWDLCCCRIGCECFWFGATNSFCLVGEHLLSGHGYQPFVVITWKPLAADQWHTYAANYLSLWTDHKFFYFSQIYIPWFSWVFSTVRCWIQLCGVWPFRCLCKHTWYRLITNLIHVLAALFWPPYTMQQAAGCLF